MLGRGLPTPARRLRGLLDGRRRVLSTAVQVERRDGTIAPINKLRGFIEYERNPEPYRPPAPGRNFVQHSCARREVSSEHECPNRFPRCLRAAVDL